MLKARARSPRKANAVTEKSNLGGTGERSIRAGVPSPVQRSLQQPQKQECAQQRPPWPGPVTARASGVRNTQHALLKRSPRGGAWSAGPIHGRPEHPAQGRGPALLQIALRPRKPPGTRGLLWGPHCSLLINVFPSHDPDLESVA